MRLWKHGRKQTTHSRLVTQASEHTVVHMAEEVVGAAWMAGLLEAERNAATARQVCTHMRDTAYDIYRSAQNGRNSEQLTQSYRELAASQQALARVRDRQEGLRQFAERERAVWVEAERMRAIEVLADRELLGQAARTAGLKEQPATTKERANPDV